jgi:hypothetical protein
MRRAIASGAPVSNRVDVGYFEVARAGSPGARRPRVLVRNCMKKQRKFP